MVMFVDGHKTGAGTSRKFRDFPHLCPGDACAIRKWLEHLAARERYGALRRVSRTRRNTVTDTPTRRSRSSWALSRNV